MDATLKQLIRELVQMDVQLAQLQQQLAQRDARIAELEAAPAAPAPPPDLRDAILEATAERDGQAEAKGRKAA